MKKIKILYIEDEKDIVENTRKPLEFLCDKLICAYDGEEGLVKYKQEKPDIVISDIRMPRKNGIELCKAIKDIDPKQPIILLTAFSEVSYFMNAIDMQVDGYLLKPIDFDLLETKVKDIITLIHFKERYNLQQKKLQEQELHNLALMKNAQMGDIIASISHQWRQPLNIISATTNGMRLKKKLNNLSDEEFYNMTDTLNETVQSLSHTIDRFGDYIEEQSERKCVILQDRISTAIDIVSASLQSHNIKLIDNINDVESIDITLIVGELTQVIINLINNSRDALGATKDGFIKINLIKKDDMVIITVEDNGGGIKADIIHQIFDPYFTTKFKSHEKGLGLYISKNIIENSMRGTLSVANSDKGALFKIELPLNRASFV